MLKNTGTLVLDEQCIVRSLWRKTYPGFKVPSRKSHAIMAMMRLATISPQTM